MIIFIWSFQKWMAVSTQLLPQSLSLLYFPGPLLNHIMKRGRLTERETSLVVRDIANGLHFLHSKGMSHRFVR